MMASLGYPVDVTGIAQLYHGLIDVLVIDESDHQHIPALESLGLRVLCCSTWMREVSDRRALAEQVLKLMQS